ncbi:MAG: MotA/TolQ/ExbB proton channel family protein [Phycisphaeraceae bacterium]
MDLKPPPQLERLIEQANAVWLDGGWAMIAIAAVAVVMFAVGTNIYLKLLAKRFELSWRSALIVALGALGVAVISIVASAPADGAGDASLVEQVFVRPAVVYERAAIIAGVGLALGLLRVLYSLLRVRGCGDWPTWIGQPSKRRGPIGQMLDFVTGGRDIEQTGVFFEELRSTEVKPFERDLLVMKVCVAAAPLLGLLGTVTGMIATFQALTGGSGGDQTQALVADGISVALITTETGLVIALAGLFYQYQLARKQQRYKAFIAHMESQCTQTVYHQTKDAGNDLGGQRQAA